MRLSPGSFFSPLYDDSHTFGNYRRYSNKTVCIDVNSIFAPACRVYAAVSKDYQARGLVRLGADNIADYCLKEKNQDFYNAGIMVAPTMFRIPWE